jgi:hypothetical protein
MLPTVLARESFLLIVFIEYPLAEGNFEQTFCYL